MASDAVVNLVVDATGADSEINVQLRRIVNDAEASAPAINLSVNIDNDSVVRAIASLEDSLRDVQSNSRDAERDTGRLMDTFGRIAGVAGSALSLAGSVGAIGVAAGGAVPLVAGLVTSLANIAPAAAAGVTAFVTMKAAALTLKLGLTGVEDALKAVFDPDADPEKVAEALERLAPEARKFVLALKDMKPAFEELRLDVQNRLFKDLDGSVERAGKTTFPIARRAALEFAGSFNTMGRNVAGAASILAKEGTLGTALKSGTDAFKELEDVPGQVVLAIGRLAAAGGPLLNRFAESVSRVVDDLSVKLEEASGSGALEEAVSGAGDALAQLGRIGSNVFGTLGNILGIADSQGDGLFGTLEKITQTLEDVTATEGFQRALTSLMGVAGTLAANVLPLVTEAFAILGPVIERLAPPVERILNTLGTELLDIMPQVGPILEKLATSFGLLLTAAEPLIPVVLDLVERLLPVLPPLLDAANRIIIALAPVIEKLAVQLGASLTPIIDNLLPIVVQLVTSFARWVEITAPLAEKWLPILVSVLLFVTTRVSELLNALLPLITTLTNFALLIASYVVPGILTLMRVVSALGDLLTGDFSGAWQKITVIIGMSGSEIRTTVGNMALAVINHFRSMGSSVVNSISSSFLAAHNAVVRQLGNALNSVRDFGASVLRTISGFSLYQSGAALISGFISGIRSQIGAVRDAASSVVSAARDYFPFSPAKKGAFSGRGWTKYSGRALIRDFNTGINEQLRGFAINWGLANDPILPAIGNLNQSAVSDAGGISSLFGTAFARVTPAVNVYLGNELLTERVQVQIDQSNTQRDRQTSQGVRF